MEPEPSWVQRRKRIFTIIEIGTSGDYISLCCDDVYMLVILISLTASIMMTFDETAAAYNSILAFHCFTVCPGKRLYNHKKCAIIMEF